MAEIAILPRRRPPALIKHPTPPAPAAAKRRKKPVGPVKVSAAGSTRRPR